MSRPLNGIMGLKTTGEKWHSGLGRAVGQECAFIF